MAAEGIFEGKDQPEKDPALWQAVTLQERERLQTGPQKNLLTKKDKATLL